MSCSLPSATSLRNIIPMLSFLHRAVPTASIHAKHAVFNGISKGNRTTGRVSYLIYVSMRHYVLTTSGDIVVCFHTAVCLSCSCVNYVMAFTICYWANYTQGKTKLSLKSENAVADDWVLKFPYDTDLRHVESSVRCHRKYKNGRIKVGLG